MPYVSSSSLDQLETSGSHAQPPDPDSPVMPNDVVLTDIPPMFSEINLTRQDVSGAAAQQSDAASLVASILTKATVVVSGLTAPELAGQDISSTAAQPYDYGSLVTSNDAELTERALYDNQMDYENVSPHRLVEEAAEMMNKHNNHDLAMQATLSTDGPRISLCSSTSSSSNDCHISCSQDSTQSLIGSEHLSLHQVGLTEQCVYSSSKCDDCDLGEDRPQPGEVSLEVDESFYSSKTSNREEESSYQVEDNNVQSVNCEQLNTASADQCAKSDDCDNHSTDDSGTGNNCDLGENKGLSNEASLDVEESFYSSKSSNDEEQSASEIHDNSTVQSVSYKQLKVDSSKISKIDDQSSSHNICQDSLQSIACEHLCLHHVASTTQCMHTVPISSDYDEHDNKLQPGEASLGADESLYDSKRSSYKEESSSDFHQLEDSTVQSASCKQLSVASADQYDCNNHSTDGSGAENDCDLGENNPLPKEASLEVKESFYSSKSSNSEEESPSEFQQLEASDKTVQSADCEQLSVQLVASADQCTISNSCNDHCTNGLGEEKQDTFLEHHSVSIDSDIQCSTDLRIRKITDDESSSDFSHNRIQSLIGSEHLSLHQVGSTEQCMFASSKCDDCDSGDEKASLEVEESFYSSKSSNSDEQSASEFHDGSTVRTTECKQLSQQHVASADQHDDQSTSELGAEKSLEGDTTQERNHPISDQSNNDLFELPRTGLEDASLEVKSSRISTTDDHCSSDFCQDGRQSIACEHLSLHQVASAAQCVHTVPISSKCDVYDLSEKKSKPGGASLEANELHYSCKTSNSEEESSSDFHQLEDNNVQSTDFEQLSVALADQCAKSNDCDNHSADSSGAENDCDLGENNPLSKEASLEVEESFYSSKSSNSEEESSSEFQQLKDQSLIGSEHLSLHQVGSTELCMSISFKCDDCDLGEEKASLEIEESLYSSKSSNSDKQSVSELHDDSTVWTTKLSPQHVASADQYADQSASELGAEEPLGDVTQEPNHLISHQSNNDLPELPPPGLEDVSLEVSSSGINTIYDQCSSEFCQGGLQSVAFEHLHQAAPAAQCMHTVPISSDCDDHDLSDNKSQHGGASLETNELLYATKTSNSEEESSSDFHQFEGNTVQTTDHEQLSADQCAKSNDCDDHSADGSGAENDHDLGENNPLPKEASLEVEESFYSSKSSNSEEESSSELKEKTIQSLISSEHLSLHQVGSTELCMSISFKCDDCDLGEEKASLEIEESLYSSKSSNSDKQSVSELHDDSTVWTTKLSPQHVASADQYADQSASELGAEEPLGDVTQEPNHLISHQSNNDLPELPPPGLEDVSLEVSSSGINTIYDQCSSEFCQGGLQSVAFEHLHQAAPAAQCMHTVPISSDCDDHDLSDNKSQHGGASLETNELLYATKTSNSEEESSSDFHQFEGNTVQTTDHEQLSADQCAKSNDCDDHSADGSGAENDHDLGENNPLPKEASLEVEESFYSSKSSNSEEESPSDNILNQLEVSIVLAANCEQLSAQFMASANQCTVSNDRDDHFNDSLGAEKQLAVDTVLEHQSVSIDRDVRNSTDLVELVLPLKETSLEVNSFRIRKIIDDKSSSDFSQDRTRSLIGSEHLSLHQVGSTEQCMSTSSKCDDCDLGEEKAFLEVEYIFYSSKSSNSDEQSASELHDGNTVRTTKCKQLSPQHVASADQYDDQGTSELGAEKSLEGAATQELNHPISDHNNNYIVELPPPGLISLEVNSSRISTIDDQCSLDFCQGGRQFIACEHLSLQRVASAAQCVHTVPISSDCDDHDLSENKSQFGGASLEANELLQSSKTSNSKEENSSDFCQLEDNTVQSASCRQPSVAPADQCTKSNDYNDHSTGAEKQLPGYAALEMHNSVSVDSDVRNNIDLAPIGLEDTSLEVNSSRTSKIIDNENSPDYFHSSIQSMDKHHSLHQVAPGVQCVHTVCWLSNSCDLSEEKTQPEEASLAMDESSYSSKQSNSEEEISSDVCQESTNCGNRSPHHVVSTASLMSDKSSTCTRFDGCRTRDVDEIIAASLEFKQMVYDSRSSTCRIRHTYTDYNLAEHKPLLEDCSLEVNVSSHNFKPTKSNSSSSSDYITRSFAYEHLSLQQNSISSTDECVHSSSRSSSCDNCDVCTETDYFTALSSQCSSESSHRTQSDHVGMTISSGEEVRIVIETDEDPSLDSSSASSDHVGMIISSGEEVRIVMETDEDPSLDSSSSSFVRDVSMESKSSSLRNDSFHSVLMQLSGSSSSEEERPYDRPHPPPIYEPY